LIRSMYHGRSVQAAKFRNKKDWDRSFVYHVIRHVA